MFYTHKVRCRDGRNIPAEILDIIGAQRNVNENLGGHYPSTRMAKRRRHASTANAGETVGTWGKNSPNFDRGTFAAELQTQRAVKQKTGPSGSLHIQEAGPRKARDTEQTDPGEKHRKAEWGDEARVRRCDTTGCTPRQQ